MEKPGNGEPRKRKTHRPPRKTQHPPPDLENPEMVAIPRAPRVPRIDVALLNPTATPEPTLNPLHTDRTTAARAYRDAAYKRIDDVLKRLEESKLVPVYHVDRKQLLLGGAAIVVAAAAAGAAATGLLMKPRVERAYGDGYRDGYGAGYDDGYRVY